MIGYSAGMIGRSAEAPSLGMGWEYSYAMVTFYDGGEAAAEAEALNGTSITHERLAKFTSESLEVNVYSRRRACGDGGVLSDDIDSDDDDDKFSIFPRLRTMRATMLTCTCPCPCACTCDM